MGKQNGHDLILYSLILASLFFVILFIVTSGIHLKPLDVSIKWDASGFSITFTGIAEIIVAIGFAIGAIIKAKTETISSRR